MKQKVDFFEKIDEISKPLARKKREDTNSQYREWNRDNSTEPADIKGIIMEYYEKIYVCKFDNLDKMYQFLGQYKLPKLI